MINSLICLSVWSVHDKQFNLFISLVLSERKKTLCQSMINSLICLSVWLCQIKKTLCQSMTNSLICLSKQQCLHQYIQNFIFRQMRKEGRQLICICRYQDKLLKKTDSAHFPSLFFLLQNKVMNNHELMAVQLTDLLPCIIVTQFCSVIFLPYHWCHRRRS